MKRKGDRSGSGQFFAQHRPLSEKKLRKVEHAEKEEAELLAVLIKIKEDGKYNMNVVSQCHCGDAVLETYKDDDAAICDAFWDAFISRRHSCAVLQEKESVVSELMSWLSDEEGIVTVRQMREWVDGCVSSIQRAEENVQSQSDNVSI